MISIGIGVAHGGGSPMAPYIVGGVSPLAVLDFERGMTTLPWSLTRASVGTYTALDGTIQSAAVDVARYTYMTGRRALLLESAATRLNGYVSIRSAWASSVSGAVLTNLSEAALGQFGGMSVASPGVAFARAGTGVQVTSGLTYAVKFLWKQGTSANVRFTFRLQIAALQSDYGGAVGSIGSIANAAGTVTVYADRTRGAYRETVFLFTPNASDTCQIAIGPYSTVAGETVNAYAWQVEAGAADTSWILGDAGVAVTRAADVVAPIDVSGLGLSGGYTAVAWGQLDAVAGSYDRIVQMDQGSDNTRHVLYYDRALGRVYGGAYYNGVSQTPASGGVVAYGAPLKAAFAIGADNFQAAVNGVAGAVDNTVTYVAPTVLRLAQSVAGNKPARILLSRVAIYPGLLTQAQLVGVTA